jgi:uncharacterized protein YfaQ (DUF2300 family)
MTTDVLSYRQYAADCLRQAQDEATPDGRTIMLNVALAWLRLAQQRETASECVPERPVEAQAPAG